MISYHHKERSLSSILPSIFQRNTSDVKEECYKKSKKESSVFSLESFNSCMKKQYSSKVFNYSKWREAQV